MEKVCTKCGELKSLEEFHKLSLSKSGRQPRCKKCRSYVAKRRWAKENPGKGCAKTARYRAAKLQRTPAWSTKETIDKFYINCPKGYAVDHIIPLQGKNVSGLHVLGNLQYLTPSENSSKSNRF